MKSTSLKDCITSDSQYNILELFLKIANQSEVKSEKVTSLKISENNLEHSDSCNSEPQSQYFNFKNQNIVKNILKSFQRYIDDANSQEQQTILKISQKNYCYFQLKKIIKRNFQTFGKRWNMKLKYLIQKSSFKTLFQFYLQHRSSEWLNLSRVQNKEEHIVVIDFLLESIEIPERCNQIKYYKKHKKSVINE